MYVLFALLVPTLLLGQLPVPRLLLAGPSMLWAPPQIPPLPALLEPLPLLALLIAVLVHLECKYYIYLK
jgi:hypothetical protein